MLQIDLLILKNNIDSVSQLILDTIEFEPSVSSSIADQDQEYWIRENPIEQKKKIAEFQKDADELYKFYQKYPSNNAGSKLENSEISLISIREMLYQYHVKKNLFIDRYSKIKKRREEIAVKIAGLNMFHKAKNDPSKKIDTKDFFCVLGIISSTNFGQLQQEFQHFNGQMFSQGHVSDSQIIFISVPNNQAEQLNKLLEHLYFVNYGLPLEFFGEGEANILKLSFEYNTLNDEEDLLEIEIAKTAPIFMDRYIHIKQYLQQQQRLCDIRNSIRCAGGHVYLLSGWISASEFGSLKKEIEKICGKNFELVVVKAENVKSINTDNIDIPTKLSNPKIIRPFEQLVTTFGIPHYREIDPTPIFACLYVLLYGAMFGDVGQGAVLFLLGVLGLLISKVSFRMIFGLMVWVGLASILFGFLYGSYFGYESAYYSWVPHPLWLSPMHSIDSLLLYAVILGMGIITLSFILGIINCFRMKDWSILIFSHKGLVAFLMYLLLLLMGWQFITNGLVSSYLFWIFGIFTFFLGLERVWEALIYKHGSLKDWWMGFFDMFEFFLSMLTNTLSFVRVGAFALTHAALMAAVFTLRDLAGSNMLAANLIVIIGNIFVIVMEGFIVGIQTLRLEYYEFFMRFFRGTGRIYKPIEHNKKVR
ncbi:MAG: V-type ATP synthase subunit I [Brevinemataceae bacterium]